MGLSIHYRGSIAIPGKLPELIEEVQEIAEIRGWKVEIYKSTFPDSLEARSNHNGALYGIAVLPPNCEAVSLSFLSNGRLCANMALKVIGDATTSPETEYLYWVHTKTQFAGIDTHLQIVHLLRYLQEKYLTGFEMRDEGGYWETEDVLVLRRQFERYGAIMDQFGQALEGMPKISGETYDEFIERIIRRIRNS